MGICEIGVVVDLAGDTSDPILWGQILKSDSLDEVHSRIASIPARLKALALRLQDQAAQLRTSQNTDALAHAAELETRAQDALLGAEQFTPKHKARLKERLDSLTVMSEDDIAEVATRLSSAVQPMASLADTRVRLGRTLHKAKAGLSLALSASESLIRKAKRGELSTVEARDLGEQAVAGVHEVRRVIRQFELEPTIVNRGKIELSPRWHPLRTLVMRAVGHHQFAARERCINIRMHGGSPPDPYMHVDWDLMLEALDILIDNAVRYSFAGIEADPRFLDIGWTFVPASARLELTVEDFGLQIHPDDREMIFGYGYRGRIKDTRRNVEGSGIGLAVAREILRAHAGDVTVDCDMFDDAAKFTAILAQGRAPSGKTTARLWLPAERFSAHHRTEA